MKRNKKLAGNYINTSPKDPAMAKYLELCAGAMYCQDVLMNTQSSPRKLGLTLTLREKIHASRPWIYTQEKHMRVFLPVARGISETEEAGNISGTGFTETKG